MALTEIPSELSSTPSIVDNGNDTAITIDANENATFAGNVGIGNSSPNERLVVSDSAGGTIAAFTDSTSADLLIQCGSGVSTITPTTGILDLGTSSTRRIRIDSSGNVGISATTYEGSVTSNASSVWISSAGYLSANINNDWGLGVNRTGTDGTLINLRKNGADVGSISTLDGNSIYIGNGEVNLRLIGVTNDIRPATSAGLNRDAAVDLGDAGARFKDIYLSGGVNFSVNANAAGMTSETLSDYEIGTWTPTLIGCDAQNFTGNEGVYVKIGSLVHVQWYSSSFTVSNAVGGNARIGGLPFAGQSGKYGTASFTHTTSFTNSAVQGFTNSAATEVYVSFEGGTSGNTWSQGFPKYVMMSCVYSTNS